MHRRLSLLWMMLMAVAAIGATLALRPTPLAAQNCSNEAELVEQTLDPDADLFAPDDDLSVSWTLHNSGDCTWSRSYRLVFGRGERMDSPRTMRLRSAVPPGETLTVTLDLLAPSETGSYEGVWQLRTAEGDNFGPELTLEIEVGDGPVASTDVVLPEVLAFGGMGAGDDAGNLTYCLEGDRLPRQPTLVVDYVALEYRYATLFVCSLAEGEAITVEVAGPDGTVFARGFVEDAPVTTTDEQGDDLTGNILSVDLRWIEQVPEGDWDVWVYGERIDERARLHVPAYEPSTFDIDYAMLTNWPLTPFNPFLAADSCHYTYAPGEEFMVGGSNLPPNATLHLGLYQERLNNGYFVAEELVQTGADGTFAHPLAVTEPGNYSLVIVQKVNPEGFYEDGTRYEFNFSEDNSAHGCFGVKPHDRAASSGEMDAPIPWRLALATGSRASSEIVVMDVETGAGYYPTYTAGECDTSEPAWWPDGEWLLYQSNCISVEVDGFSSPTAGGDFDLYALRIDPTYLLPAEETFARLTQTPAFDETEPDANLDGLIVYRRAAAGTPLDASGELWLLDILEEESVPLGNLFGRSPVWSPDGSRIAFMSDVEGSWQIYVYDWVEDLFWLVSTDCATHCLYPAWSPDGEQLLYQRVRALEDLTPAELWMADVDGGTSRLWLSGEYARPTWSAEGWIAFQGPDGIYRATPGRRPIVERYLYSDPSFATHAAPVWSR